MQISICATGDAMLLEPFPDTYSFEKLSNIIKACDVRITNLESVYTNWDCNASTFCGGQWINSEPENLDEIIKFGFNLYGCANNHSMDYSFDGVRSTQNELKKRNMPFAGIGNSLSEASKSAIFTIPGKNIKVSFICVATTTIHTDAARAGDSKGTIPARPGINSLRIKTKYYVSKKHLNVLREIAQNTYMNGERDNARNIGSLPPEDKGTLNFGGTFFEETDGEERKSTCCDQRDLKRILHEIEVSKRESDYVIVQIHSHQIKHADYSEPDFFLEEFAHQCIDYGACAIIGGGTHQLKPIELYKGKPIFYSLGNFIFQDEKIKYMPDDFWDKYNYDRSLSLEECKKIKTKNGTIGLVTDINNYLSVIPIISFMNGELINIELVPITLGFYEMEQLKGLPVVAEKATAAMIAEKLSEISKPYGTVIDMKDTVMEVKIK